MDISQKGIDLIKQFEGCKLKAYQDIKGVWTIGVGHTKGVYAGQEITQREADEMLKTDLSIFSGFLNRYAKDIKLNQNQFDALVSFIFNIGIGNFADSTVYKLIKANPNDTNIGTWWVKWNKCRINGVLQEVPGLTTRRKEEYKLYSS